MNIGNKTISKISKPYFIADIAANHDGNLDRAKKLISLAAEAGADAAKFQHFNASSIVSRNGFIGFGAQLSHQASWNKSVYDTYNDASINIEWTQILYEECNKNGIEFLSTPYSIELSNHIAPYVNAFKIGSGDIDYFDLLEHISNFRKPIIIATGACCLDDVINAYEILKANKNDISILQCNTNYTADPLNYKYVNLNVIKTYQKLFPNCLIGLSDHTTDTLTSIASVALGAVIIEKHFTDDKNREGPDHKFAMDPKDWKKMVNDCNIVHEALGNGQKIVEENEIDSVKIQRRGIYAKKDLKIGHIIRPEDITVLRPFYEDGFRVGSKNLILGKKLVRDVSIGENLKKADIDG